MVVVSGDPLARILETADAYGCSLIVTGTARDETLGRLLLGTTVEKLARQARQPVLVVKNRPRRPYRDVLVATDFSAGSRQALRAALYLVPEADLTLFHAYDVPFQGKNVPDEAVTRNFYKAAEQNSRNSWPKRPNWPSAPGPRWCSNAVSRRRCYRSIRSTTAQTWWSPARTAAPASCAPPSAAWPNDCWSRCPAMC